MHRFINIDGVHNFRDFGNYKTKNGETLSPNILFRSAQFGGISDDGCDALSALGVRNIVDLRRANERKNIPQNMEKLGLNPIISNSGLDNGGDLPPHLQYLVSGDATKEKTFAFMVKTYRTLPYEPIYKNLFKQAFEVIAKTQSPTIIHCAAGKDRTGILCALILSSLDVDEDVIIDDYLLTNHVPGLDTLIEKYAAEVSKRLGKYIDVNISRPLGIVDADYIRAGFQEMRDKSGSIKGYLNEIGVDDKIINTIKDVVISK